MTLAHGGEDIYDGWMKNKKSAMNSCTDGFRSVSFLIEVIEKKEKNYEIYMLSKVHHLSEGTEVA